MLDQLHSSLRPQVKALLESSDSLRESELVGVLTRSKRFHPSYSHISEPKKFNRFTTPHVRDVVNIIGGQQDGGWLMNRMLEHLESSAEENWFSARNRSLAELLERQAQATPRVESLDWVKLVGFGFAKMLKANEISPADEHRLFSALQQSRFFHPAYSGRPFERGKPFQIEHAEAVFQIYPRYGEIIWRKFMSHLNIARQFSAATAQLQPLFNLVHNKDLVPSQIDEFFTQFGTEKELEENLSHLQQSILLNGFPATLAAVKAGRRKNEIVRFAMPVSQDVPDRLAERLLGTSMATDDLRWAVKRAKEMDCFDAETILNLATAKKYYGPAAMKSWALGVRPDTTTDPYDPVFLKACELVRFNLVTELFHLNRFQLSREQQKTALILASYFDKPREVLKWLRQGQTVEQIQLQLERAESRKFAREAMTKARLAFAQQLRNMSPAAAEWLIDQMKKRPRR